MKCLVFVFVSGYVCNRTSVNPLGCCDVRKGYKLKSKHRCDTCMKNACCVVYEYCVSCCLKPDKVKSDLNYHCYKSSFPQVSYINCVY